MPTFDGIHHQVVAQMLVGSYRTRMVVLDSKTGRKRYSGPVGDEVRTLAFSSDGSFFVEVINGDTTKILLVHDNESSVVAQRSVKAAVSKNDTALLVIPGESSDRVERVRPDGHVDVLLDAPDIELRLVAGSAGAIFVWSKQETIYTGFAEDGPLQKAGSLPGPFTAAFTHPSSSTALFLGFDEDKVNEGGAVYSARVGGPLVKLREGAGIRLLDITSDGRRVVTFHGPEHYGLPDQTPSGVDSETVPTGHEAPELDHLGSLQYALGALILDSDSDRVLYTAYRGAFDGVTPRVDPEVRSVAVNGGTAQVLYDGWSILDLGDASTSLVVVSGHDPGI